MEEARFFVGNIPSQATEEDLKNEFGCYGVVKSVELKKKTNENCYGFVNIEIDGKLVQKCIREFSQQKFMGNYLSVSRAKESFLDRLKKEREGNTIGSKLLEMSMRSGNETEKESVPFKPTVTFELPTIQKEVSSEESSSESEEEEIVPAKQHIARPVEPKKLDQAALDEMKRQKSVQKLKEMQQEKKDAIKNALSSIDSAPRNNKIVFEEPEPVQKLQKPKSNLFEDEDMDEVPESFKVKKQFEGRKGEKLLELQSRFQGDKRFKIDEKFAEVADDIIDTRKKYTREELKERKKFRKEMQDWDQNELKEERNNQLSILESITGESTGLVDKFSKPAQKGMLRFDPTKKSHEKYLDVVRGDDVIADDSSNESDNDDQQPQAVGEDRFYQVSDKLTEALQTKSSESKPFSIFSMLGIEHKSDDENVDEPQEEVEIKLPPKVNSFHLAKFKYESSDTDEEVEAVKAAKKKKVKPQKVTKFGKYSKTGVFHYNFFFRDDDPRLKEGLKFLVKPENETPEALQEKRQKLKAIVKNSIRKAKKDQSSKQGYSKKRKVK